MARKLRIAQVKSAAKCTSDMVGTLHALGLRRMHQTVEQNDTPQIRGMVKKIVHLVKVEEIQA